MSAIERNPIHRANAVDAIGYAAIAHYIALLGDASGVVAMLPIAAAALLVVYDVRVEGDESTLLGGEDSTDEDTAPVATDGRGGGQA
jgi:hypothetical protein